MNIIKLKNYCSICESPAIIKNIERVCYSDGKTFLLKLGTDLKIDHCRVRMGKVFHHRAYVKNNNTGYIINMTYFKNETDEQIKRLLLE